jgi:hypothetical protein
MLMATKEQMDKAMRDPVLRDTVAQLLETVRAGVELAKRTDVEFAEILEQVLADKDVTSVEYEVIEQAVDRLRRSAGGPFKFPEEGERFYLWDTRNYSGDFMLWWRHEGHGYTYNLDEAGLYSSEDARTGRDTDVPVPEELARKMCCHVIDVDRLLRADPAEMTPQMRARWGIGEPAQKGGDNG